MIKQLYFSLYDTNDLEPTIDYLFSFINVFMAQWITM